MLTVVLTMTVTAQTRTQEYMKKIPALPKDSCNITRASAEDFIARVAVLRDQMVSEIEQLRESIDSHMEANAPTAEENAMKQMSQMYGMSQADLEKMKNAKNMSAADKQALANKMMSQQANMTMDEAKNLAKMSEAGRQAYTEAYATEAMATANTDPNQASRNDYARNLLQQQCCTTGSI
jgi:exosome complex RNA-binding protein Rrp42 (RNase PH superfamily)